MSEGEVSCPEHSTVDVSTGTTSAAIDGQGNGENQTAAIGPLNWNNEHEDKNPFSGFSEEHLEKIDEMLSSEEVKKILQQTVGEDFVTTMAECPLEVASPIKQPLTKQEGSGSESGAAAGVSQVAFPEDPILSAAVSDHAYAIPAHFDPSPVKPPVPAAKAAAVATQISTTPTTPVRDTKTTSVPSTPTKSSSATSTPVSSPRKSVRIAIRKDRKRKIDTDEGDSEQTEDETKEESVHIDVKEVEVCSVGRGRGRGRGKKVVADVVLSPQATRVSSRISDLKQQKLAEKILEENRQREKDALEAEKSRDSASTQDEESGKGLTDEELPKKRGRKPNAAAAETKIKEVSAKFQDAETDKEMEAETAEGTKMKNATKSGKMAQTQTQTEADSDEEEEDEEEEREKKTKVKGKKKKVVAKKVKGKIKKSKVKGKKAKGKKKKKQKSEAQDEQSGEEETEESSPKKRKKKKKLQSSEEGSGEEPSPPKKVKKKKKSTKSGDQESDGEQSSPKKGKKKKKGDKLKKNKIKKKGKKKGTVEDKSEDEKTGPKQLKSTSDESDVPLKTLKRKSTGEEQAVPTKQIKMKSTSEDSSDNVPLKQVQKGLKKKGQQAPVSSPSLLKKKKSQISAEDDNKPKKKDFKQPVDAPKNQLDKGSEKNKNLKDGKKVAFKAASKKLVKKPLITSDTVTATKNSVNSKPICDTDSVSKEQQQSCIQSKNSEVGHENHHKNRPDSVDSRHSGDSGGHHHHHHHKHKHDDSSRHRHDSKHSDDTDQKHKHHRHDSKDSKHSEDGNSSQVFKRQDSKDSENSASHQGKHSDITPSKMSRRKSRKSEEIVVDPTVTDLFKPDVIMPREEKKEEGVKPEDQAQSDVELPDDPNKLYCICRQPHNSKFMICCNQCEEWFHGSCVGISRERGKDMEKNNEEYVCPSCTDQNKDSTNSKVDVKESVDTQKLPPTEQGPTNAEEVHVPKTDEKADSKTEVKVEIALKTEPILDVKIEKADDVKPKTEVVEGAPATDGQKVVSSQPGNQHQLGEIRKRSIDESEDKKKRQFKGLKHTKERKSYQKCIGANCVFDAREGSVYCSQDCIAAHTKQALKLIHDQQKRTESKTSSESSGKKKVVVLERKTGRIVTGPLAPTEDTLQNWLEQHQTFEVLCPSIKTSTFYSKKEKAKEREKDKQGDKEKHKSRHGDKDKHKEKDGQAKDSKDKKDDGPDPVRLNVRSSLRDALAKRASCADDIMLSSSEIKSMAVGVEEELFRYFREVGSKYKSKYRTLLFNIKDTKNKVLFRRILTGRIKPFRLVRMSVDELATKELAQWREHEAKQTLDMIEQTEKEHQQEHVHILKKTHKGEVDVEEEDLSTLQDTYKPVKVEKAKPEQKVDLLSELIPDTTDKHRTHLFDLNCKICTGKVAPTVDEPAPKKVKIAHSVSKEDSEETADGKEKKSKDEDIKPEDVVKEVLKAIQRAKEEAPVSHKASAGSSVTVRSPDSALQSGLEKKSKFTPSGPMLWKGFIFMQDVTKFITTAYSISGPTDHHLDMQDTIYVCGRIAPEQVWDYLARIKHAGSKDILVIRFIPGTGEEKTSYIQLYSYLNSRSRCGVVGNTGKYIKDFYIVPLASHSKIPSVLRPFNGPGLEENRPHMLIGVMVRVKMKRTSESSSGARQATDKKMKVDSSVKKTDKKIETKPKPHTAAKDNSGKIAPSKIEKQEPEKTSTDVVQKPSTHTLERQYSRPSVLEKSKTVSHQKPPLPSPSATKPSGFYTPRVEKPYGGNTPNSGSSTPSTVGRMSRSSTPPTGKPSGLSIDSKDPIVENYGTEDSVDDSTEVDAYSPTEVTLPARNPDDEKPYDPEEEAMKSQSVSVPTTVPSHTTQSVTKPSNPLGQKLAVDQMLTKIAHSKNPKEATAAMVATLAAAPNMEDQRKILQQLTEKVESQKRMLSQKKVDKSSAPGSTVHETSVVQPMTMDVTQSEGIVQPMTMDVTSTESIVQETISHPVMSVPQSLSQVTTLPSILSQTADIVPSVTTSESFTNSSSQKTSSVSETKLAVITEHSSVSTTSEQSVQSSNISVSEEPSYTISSTLQSTIKSLFTDVPLASDLQKRLKSQVADSTRVTEQVTIVQEPPKEPNVIVPVEIPVEKPQTVTIKRVKKKEKRSKTFLGFEYESSSSSEEEFEEIVEEAEETKNEITEIKETVNSKAVPSFNAETVVTQSTEKPTDVETECVLPFSIEQSGEGSSTPTQDEPVATPTRDEPSESVIVAASKPAEIFQLPSEDQDLRIKDIDERIGNSRKTNVPWMKSDQNPFLKASEPSESGDAAASPSDVPAWAQDVDHRKLGAHPSSQPFPFLQPPVQPAPPLPPSPPPPPPPPDHPDWSDDRPLQDCDMRVQRKAFHMQPESELVPPGEEAVPQDIDLRKRIPPSLLKESKQTEERKKENVDIPVGGHVVVDESPLPLPPLPPQMLLNVPQTPPVHMMMGMPQTSPAPLMMNIPQCSAQESPGPKRLPPVRFDTATGKIEVLLTPDGSIPEEFQSENFVADDYRPQNYPKYEKEEIFEELSVPQDMSGAVQSGLGNITPEIPPLLRQERRPYRGRPPLHNIGEHRASRHDSEGDRYEHRSHRSQDDRPVYREREAGFGRGQSRGRGFERGMPHGRGFPGNRGRGRGPRRGRGRGGEWFS